METIHRKQNNKIITLICSTLAVNIRFKKLGKICCSSKFIYLLPLEKYKTTVQKQ